MDDIIKNGYGTLKTCLLKPAQALRLAMEDEGTAHFMRAVFSLPEQRAEVLTSSWLVRDGPESRWMILIGEKMPGCPPGKKSLANIVLVELEGSSGAVLRREYICSLLGEEVREKVTLWLRRGGYKGRRIRSELRQIVR